MREELLSDSVDVLKCIRAELQSNVKSSVIAELDKVIQDLEAAQESGIDTAKTALEILRFLGSLIEKIPAIASAIELFMK